MVILKKTKKTMIWLNKKTLLVFAFLALNTQNILGVNSLFKTVSNYFGKNEVKKEVPEKEEGVKEDSEEWEQISGDQRIIVHENQKNNGKKLTIDHDHMDKLSQKKEKLDRCEERRKLNKRGIDEGVYEDMYEEVSPEEAHKNHQAFLRNLGFSESDMNKSIMVEEAKDKEAMKNHPEGEEVVVSEKKYGVKP